MHQAPIFWAMRVRSPQVRRRLKLPCLDQHSVSMADREFVLEGRRFVSPVLELNQPQKKAVKEDADLCASAESRAKWSN